jgi:hypothetical protein
MVMLKNLVRAIGIVCLLSAVGCSKVPSVQDRMSRLFVECEAQSDEYHLSCLEMRQLHRENPGVVNPAANAAAQELIRKNDLMDAEMKENQRKMDEELKAYRNANP